MDDIRLSDRSRDLDKISDSVNTATEKISIASKASVINHEVRAVRKVVNGLQEKTGYKNDDKEEKKDSLDKAQNAVDASSRIIKFREKNKLNTTRRDLEKLSNEIESDRIKNAEKKDKVSGNSILSDKNKEQLLGELKRTDKRLASQQARIKSIDDKIETAKNDSTKIGVNKSGYTSMRSSAVDSSSRERSEKRDEGHKTEEKFFERERTVKEKSQIINFEEQTSKIGNRSAKINDQHSLSKLRGRREETVKKDTVTKRTASSTAGTVVTERSVEMGAKATVGVSSTGASVAGSVATEAGGTALAPVIAVVAFAFALIMIVVLIILCAVSSEKQTNPPGKTSSASIGEIQLWNALMAHFENNETAVLGIMCNVKYESDFISNNLEQVNNDRWGISDEEYTTMINNGTISKEEFCKSMFNGSTSGSMTSGGWDNRDGGYGFCQYTTYEKKSSLYDFATNWFSATGKGKGRPFDISDNAMQASYVVYILDNEYKYLDTRLRNASSIHEAVSIWLKNYEVPDGNLDSIAQYREKDAESIRARCKQQGGGIGLVSGDFAELDGTYFVQEDSGPCGICSTASLIKRYCYMKGDARWDEITPEMITDDGRELDTAICNVHGGGGVGWYVYDSKGVLHEEKDCSNMPLCENTITIHGITCHYNTVDVGGFTDSELKAKIDEHPEGIAVCAKHSGNRDHIKVITSYTEDANGITFYCTDPGSWGSSSNGNASTDAEGRFERPLSTSSCWTDISGIEWYRYIE